jgi:hypothetical protein
MTRGGCAECPQGKSSVVRGRFLNIDEGPSKRFEKNLFSYSPPRIPPITEINII